MAGREEFTADATALSSLLSNLLKERGISGDVEFLITEKGTQHRFRGHRLVTASHSPVLDSLIPRPKILEGRLKTPAIRLNVRAEAFGAILNWMYGVSIPYEFTESSVQMWLDTLIVAVSLQIEVLERHCYDIITRELLNSAADARLRVSSAVLTTVPRLPPTAQSQALRAAAIVRIQTAILPSAVSDPTIHGNSKQQEQSVDELFAHDDRNRSHLIVHVMESLSDVPSVQCIALSALVQEIHRDRILSEISNIVLEEAHTTPNRSRVATKLDDTSNTTAPPSLQTHDQLNASFQTAIMLIPKVTAMSNLDPALLAHVCDAVYALATLSTTLQIACHQAGIIGVLKHAIQIVPLHACRAMCAVIRHYPAARQRAIELNVVSEVVNVLASISEDSLSTITDDTITGDDLVGPATSVSTASTSSRPRRINVNTEIETSIALPESTRTTAPAEHILRCLGYLCADHTKARSLARSAIPHMIAMLKESKSTPSLQTICLSTLADVCSTKKNRVLAVRKTALISIIKSIIDSAGTTNPPLAAGQVCISYNFFF
jgi:hypothetical protein